jgi:hypothetical protein
MVLTGYLYYKIFWNIDVPNGTTRFQIPETDDSVLYAIEQKEKKEGRYEPPEEITYYNPSDEKMAVEESYEQER